MTIILIILYTVYKQITKATMKGGNRTARTIHLYNLDFIA